MSKKNRPEVIGLRKANAVLDLLRSSLFLDERLPVLGEIQTEERTLLKDYPKECQIAYEVRYGLESGVSLDLVLGGNESKKKKNRIRWSLLFLGLNWKAQWGEKTISLRLQVGYQETLLMSRFLFFEKVAELERKFHIPEEDIVSDDLVNAVLGETVEVEKVISTPNPYEEEVLTMFARIILSVWRAFPMRTSEEVAFVRNESTVGAKAMS